MNYTITTNSDREIFATINGITKKIGDYCNTDIYFAILNGRYWMSFQEGPEKVKSCAETFIEKYKKYINQHFERA